MFETRKVYIYEIDNWTDKNGQKCCDCDITTDENLARQIDENYHLATLNQVEEFISLGYEIIPVVEVEEGIYGFYEVNYITNLGDKEHYGGYVFLQHNTEDEIKDLARAIEKMMK